MAEKKRTEVPETSTTLLRDVADSQHARWAVFHSRYEPMMRSFMRESFPSLDADDIIQETFLALAKALPHYVYNPKENGHCHNYLTGVLRNKALKLPDWIYGRAKNYADMREISMAELFRSAIEMYVMVHTADEPMMQTGSTWTPPVCRKTGLKTDPFADENWRENLYAERNAEVG